MAEKKGFTAEEKAAMRARAKELKEKEDGDSAVRAAIAAMTPADRALAKRVDELVRAAAPELTPKTWYGMPAYAKDGNVVCFFQAAQKFKSRYSTLGFSDKAALDDGVHPLSDLAIRLGERCDLREHFAFAVLL